MTPDYRVYVITADLPRLHRTHEDIAAAAVKGGANVVQMRDKEMEDAEFEEIARRVSAIVKEAGALFIINDRPNIAVRVQADGVHAGQSDENTKTIRKRLKTKMILGVSATNYQEAIVAARQGADYLGVGPVFPTGSKPDAAAAMGVEELTRICRDIDVPVIAIGGVKRANLHEIISAGASGAAVIAAVAEAPDMVEATANMKRMWEKNDAAGRLEKRDSYRQSKGCRRP